MSASESEREQSGIKFAGAAGCRKFQKVLRVSSSFLVWVQTILRVKAVV